MTANTFLFPATFFTLAHKPCVVRLVSAICIGVSLALLAQQSLAANTEASSASAQEIKLWNGNKTASRQQYEREVLELALAATRKSDGDWVLRESLTDYPKAEDEAGVFRRKGFDIFGTVAGNAKLAGEKKILVSQPLMKGLLGHRILIIRAEDKEKFAAVKTTEQLQQLTMGIPATWADAELFRQNGYPVVEKGSFDELFTRLQNREFDYVTFGANEVTGVFNERAAQSGELLIDRSLLVYYPFPLVFYVNPRKPELAKRVENGLKIIATNGELDALFDRYFGKELAAIQLQGRAKITLKNPILPPEMEGFSPSL